MKPSPEFVAAVEKMGARLGLDHRWLLAVMDHESNLDPAIVNKKSKATGLIQFLPNTAKGLGTTVEALARMTALEQLPWVEKYFRQWKGLQTAGDVAAAVFYPKSIGQLDLIIGRKGQKAYEWNKSLDRDNKGYINMVDYARMLRRYGWRWGVEMSDVDAYQDIAKKAQSMQTLLDLSQRIMKENPKSNAVQSAFGRFSESLTKLIAKLGKSASPVYDEVDYRTLMVSKIRGAFQIQSDYSPTTNDYLEAAKQTIMDVGEKTTQVVEAVPDVTKYGALGLLAVGGIYLLTMLKRS